MYYYAYINENNVCQEVYMMPSPIPVAGYIEITEEQYTSRSVVGQVYDPVTQTWSDVPEWSCNATEVQYGEGAESVKDKLDAIDEVLANIPDAEDLHNHDNKAVLDGITAEKVSAWDAGASGSGTPGADGEDGITPHIGTNGNWYLGETDTGVAATGPAGADGEDGADGADGANGADGADGITPHIGSNGHWFIGETDTGVSAQGPAGASGTDLSATELLALLATVDGQNSGLDADKLDGHDATYFATATQLNGKANEVHTHTEYAAEGHTHTPTSIGAAPSNHSHNGYAASGHSHSEYLPTSGGTVSGNLNVTGIFRVNGQQSVFDSGTMITLSTNNRETMIAGSKIYSKTTISVSSDRRLKENIEEVSADDMTKFINGLGIKSFNYIGSDEPCIGVIAQEVTESNPELAKYFVRKDENGYYSVKASDLVFPLIAAVQKLAKEVEALKK